MKPRTLLHLLGWRPTDRTYGTCVQSYRLPRDGVVQFAHWQHPKTAPTIIQQSHVDQLREFLREGDTAIDIGAHTGDSTVPIALAVGKTGIVFALEPNPYVFTVLKQNSQLNQQTTHIHPLMFAATETDGEVEFLYSDPGYCNGGDLQGISKWVHGHAFKLKVQGRNLERYLQRTAAEKVTRLRFIKIDAEGLDATVVRSMTSLIRETRPYLKVEFYKHMTHAERVDLFQLLEGLGYELHVVEHDGYLPKHRVRPAQLDDQRHFDVICLPVTRSPRLTNTRVQHLNANKALRDVSKC